MKAIFVKEETYQDLLMDKVLIRRLGLRPTFDNVIKYLREKALDLKPEIREELYGREESIK